MPTLVIPNVDFELLEEQRQMLSSMIQQDSMFALEAQWEALEGILEMLNHWSDAQLEKESQ